MPRQHVENTKEFWNENEAKRVNKHTNKRIIYWPPFWNKVYIPGETQAVLRMFFRNCNYHILIFLFFRNCNGYD